MSRTVARCVLMQAEIFPLWPSVLIRFSSIGKRRGMSWMEQTFYITVIASLIWKTINKRSVWDGKSSIYESRHDAEMKEQYLTSGRSGIFLISDPTEPDLCLSRDVRVVVHPRGGYVALPHSLIIPLSITSRSSWMNTRSRSKLTRFFRKRTRTQASKYNSLHLQLSERLLNHERIHELFAHLLFYTWNEEGANRKLCLHLFGNGVNPVLLLTISSSHVIFYQNVACQDHSILWFPL